MDMFVVRGGLPLNGRVAVGGAKNAALPIMAAAILADGPTLLHGVPALVDVATMAALLRSLGVDVCRPDGSPPSSLRLLVRDQSPAVAHYDLVRRMRAGVCVLGPLLARRGRAVVSLPGGCNIGDRPIDLHLKGLRAMGADVRIERGYVVAKAKRLRGAHIDLGGPFGSTVTGTCNVMSAATLAEGATVIESAACEPEVVDLGGYLNRMGAVIRRDGPTAIVSGVPRLSGASVMASDLRASAALVLAALGAEGTTVIKRIYHLDRGYERLEDKLTALGADVRRVKDAPENAAPPIPVPHFAAATATARSSGEPGASATGGSPRPETSGR